MDDNRGATESCAGTQAERGSAILPTGTDRWVGSSPLGVSTGLDWLTVSGQVPQLHSNIPHDTDSPDAVAEVQLERRMIGAFGGYSVLGPSTRHGTQWYREGTFGDDGSWDVQREGRGRNAGSVVMTARGTLLARLPDRGLAAATVLHDDLGLRVRRVDVMAEAPLTAGALVDLVGLLERREVRLPRGLRFSYNGNNGETHTLYLGSQASDEYVCLYDRRGVDRVEVRGRGAIAETVVALLVAGVHPRQVVASRLVRYGSVWESGPGRQILMALGATGPDRGGPRAS